MPINITMPALSPTMEEGNLAKWLVDEGTVAKIVVPAGTEGVKVNALIAVLAADGEDVGAAASGAGAAAPAQKAAAAAAPKAEAAPAAAAAPAQAAGLAVSADGNRTFSSPLARRLAKEAGIDLSAISASGPHGRVGKSDVEAAVSGGGAKAAPAAADPQSAAPAHAAAPKSASDERGLALFEPGSYELVPHDGMRKVIAKRLVESKQTVPHFYVTVDCELDALLALRAQLNDAAPRKEGAPAYKLSVNDMVIKAMALALRDVPDANVSWTEANMVKHKHADVGVAVSIPGGLITPIIRKAEEKTLSAISNEMRDLGKRAKDRKLKPEEYQGGTSSVSNMGMMGVKQFAAVINPPHAPILAVGAGAQRPGVTNGQLAVATVMTVTLETDHRCVDGALGAELLQAFKGYIENPMGMLV